MVEYPGQPGGGIVSYVGAHMVKGGGEDGEGKERRKEGRGGGWEGGSGGGRWGQVGGGEWRGKGEEVWEEKGAAVRGIGRGVVEGGTGRREGGR